jgi:hypothetical protein
LEYALRTITRNAGTRRESSPLSRIVTASTTKAGSAKSARELRTLRR